MRILFVASEVAPFAGNGELAEMAAALPQGLAERGHDVRVVMPAYDSVIANGFLPARSEPGLLGFDLGPRRVAADVEQLSLGAVPVYLIDVPALFRLGSIYTEGPEEAYRFAVLSRAVLELCQRWLWSPDVIHCHDWRTALVPAYLESQFAGEEAFAATSTVLTVHDLTDQGGFPTDVIPGIGMGGYRDLLDQAELAEGRVGILATGLRYADAITTLSPTYARDILTSELGLGLDGILSGRRADLVGILNGVDVERWNPATDRLLPHRYSARSLWRKEWNKRALLASLDLDYHERVPVLGIVGRLAEAKGIDVLLRPISALLARTDVRFVAVGTGERRLEAALASLAERFPSRAAFVPAYDERLAHLIHGGVDIALMPSRFEPSGRDPMHGLAYGTPPLVHRTGGLADTVQSWDGDDGAGTGFTFDAFDEGAVWSAVGEALSTFADRKQWKRLQLNGMALDNSWDRATEEYEVVYQRLAETARSRRVASSPT